MHGQEQDNGSNMKVEEYRSSENNTCTKTSGIFVTCGNNSPNLVSNNATLSCPIAPLIYNNEEVYDALYEASQGQRLDAFCRNIALLIARKLQNSAFLCRLLNWYEIFLKVNVVSEVLQKVTSILQSAMGLIKSVQIFLEEMRCDGGVDSIVTYGKKLADKISVAPEFGKEIQVRPRNIKRRFSYEGEDEPIEVGKTSFQVDFFNAVLDANHLKKACTGLQIVLSDLEECDLNGNYLFDELQIYAPILSHRSSQAKALSFITKNCYVETFSNVPVSLRILLQDA
ncbi:hypothetical protein PR048_012387 [Dryococelus australis]|uniref:Uncharacterized protein n=1 Tax=Dryococelus australis TaxID=614101 RepID=A0ABQ9HQJ3_9NEOP|nr:hypothetical protein PR048_012387 [Dryococelus australis]